MDKYQLAIIEYDKSRKQISLITKKIGESIGVFAGDRYKKACTCNIKTDHPLDDSNCFTVLYKWNNEYEAYREEWEAAGGSLIGPLDPDMREKPVLCNAGKITDQLIQDRKAAKKRFGVAKRRLSSLARGMLPK